MNSLKFDLCARSFKMLKKSKSKQKPLYDSLMEPIYRYRKLKPNKMYLNAQSVCV